MSNSVTQENPTMKQENSQEKILSNDKLQEYISILSQYNIMTSGDKKQEGDIYAILSDYLFYLLSHSQENNPNAEDHKIKILSILQESLINYSTYKYYPGYYYAYNALACARATTEKGFCALCMEPSEKLSRVPIMTLQAPESYVYLFCENCEKKRYLEKEFIKFKQERDKSSEKEANIEGRIVYRYITIQLFIGIISNIKLNVNPRFLQIFIELRKIFYENIFTNVTLQLHMAVFPEKGFTECTVNNFHKSIFQRCDAVYLENDAIVYAKHDYYHFWMNLSLDSYVENWDDLFRLSKVFFDLPPTTKVETGSNFRIPSSRLRLLNFPINFLSYALKDSKLLTTNNIQDTAILNKVTQWDKEARVVPNNPMCWKIRVDESVYVLKYKQEDCKFFIFKQL